MRTTLACALLLAVASVGAVPVKRAHGKQRGSPSAAPHGKQRGSAGPRRAQGAPIDIPCASVPAAFCTADAGCKLEKSGACVKDSAAPPVNCTSLMTSSGEQVAAAEAQLLAAVSGASSSTWTTMQGTQAALGKAKDAMKNYDSALKNYNSSLIEYEKEATKLEALKAALDELTANCSIPTPPPTCADALLDLKTAIAKQTATCEIKWVATTLGQQKMELASEVMTAQDKITADAMAAPAKVFSDAAATISAAEADKSSTIAFWDLVIKACVQPAVAPSWKAAAEQRIRRHAHN